MEAAAGEPAQQEPVSLGCLSGCARLWLWAQRVRNENVFSFGAQSLPHGPSVRLPPSRSLPRLTLLGSHHLTP